MRVYTNAEKRKLRAEIKHWEQFAELHPELQQNVNVGVAPPSIDHGRLATIERNAKLATLELHVTHPDLGLGVFTGNEILSPRRIWRRGEGVLNAWAADRIATNAHQLIKDWIQEGYPQPPQVDGLPEGTVYLSAFGPVTIFLVSRL